MASTSPSSASATRRTIRATYDAARSGGTAVIVGVGRMEDMVQFSAFEMFFANKTLKGSMYGSAQRAHLHARAAGALEDRQARPRESMISRRIKLEEVNDAFRAMQAGEVIRSVIDF